MQALAKRLDSIQPWTTWDNTDWFAHLLQSEHNSSLLARCQQLQQAGGKVTLALGSRMEMFLLILRSACWRLSQHLLHACHSAIATESTGQQQT